MSRIIRLKKVNPVAVDNKRFAIAHKSGTNYKGDIFIPEFRAYIP